MKLLLILTLCTSFLGFLEGKECPEADIETELDNKDCNETEYNSYVECLRNRMKRSLDCDNSIQEVCEDCEDDCTKCNCEYCTVNTCHSSCEKCCPNNPPCTTHRCCHKTCHARCQSSKCRSKCRKTCSGKISEGGSSAVNITTEGKSRHNITTIINLHNVINNTNVIDIPILLNNTNINNITLTGDTTSNSGNIQEKCCYVIGPKQCVPTDKYPYVRCFHIRKKTCGAFCEAPIVHVQPHRICNQNTIRPSCQQQVSYIPQPQPRCAYQTAWPYVSCGGQPQKQFCGGCYTHYNSPFPQLPPPGCSPSCYDDGFGMGPYYRQGPFYRPGYAHVPSCYQTGSCGLYGYGDNPYANPYVGAFAGPYGGFGGGFGGGFPGGIGYPPPPYGAYPGYNGFPGYGYPPNTYENKIHVQQNTDNFTKEGQKSPNENNIEVEDSLSPTYIPVPFVPQYNAGFGGALGYPPPPYGAYPGYSGLPGYGYPPIMYNYNKVPQPVKEEENPSNETNGEVESPSQPSYLPAPLVPQYSAVGYPFPFAPQVPPYNLPPEVDIQATITHPEKDSRYAQITITKQPSKRENAEVKENVTETTTTKEEIGPD